MFGKVRKYDVIQREKLDELIFRVETGQQQMSWKAYQRLKANAQELTNREVRLSAAQNGSTCEAQLRLYRKARHLERMEAMVSRHLALHPEDQSMDPLIEALGSARAGKDLDPELIRKFRKKFDYLYANRPVPPHSGTKR